MVGYYRHRCGGAVEALLGRGYMAAAVQKSQSELLEQQTLGVVGLCGAR